MSLLNALRAGIKVADKVTRNGGLHGVVMFERQIGTGAYGPTYASAVPLHALVDFKATMVRTPGGELTATRATVTLLNVAEISAATAGLGVRTNDKFTLPDGSTGPTLDITGFVDAGTLSPLATTVLLG